MKQHITKEQWNELELSRNKLIFIRDTTSPHSLPTIGQMIEFLRGDWTFIRNNIHTLEITTDDKFYKEPELADALWEAVKNKLK